MMDQLIDVMPNDLSGETLDDLVMASRAAKEFIDSIEAVRKRVGEEIMQRMCEDGVTDHQTPDGLRCELCVGRTPSRLSETRLVEAGVSADVIADCREEGTPYTYVKITRPKESAS